MYIYGISISYIQDKQTTNPMATRLCNQRPNMKKKNQINNL